jgi:hypothetical protein
MDDVRKECYHLLGFDASEGSDLDPFGEFVNGAFCEGPTRSNHHTMKGHVIGIVYRAWAGMCGFLA